MTPKHQSMITWDEQPLNAETPLDALCQAHVTPTELFYVRNHGPVPVVDADAYLLSVGGCVRQPLMLSLHDLRSRFQRVTTTAALMCAGNRRDELMVIKPIQGQVPWGAGAIGNAVWSGVRLRDVLYAANVTIDDGHVAFIGLDQAHEEGHPTPFGGSIPLDKAFSGDVLLADQMNGEPLPAVHGFPLRVVVPGYIGARSVKWLSTISVQAEPSTNYFQARTYRLLAPAGADGTDTGIALGELPVNAVICSPRDGETIPVPLRAHGYAITGGARRIERVDVSLDHGETFLPARLTGDRQPGTWRRWQADLDAEPGPCQLVVRAWDSAAMTQPEAAARIWNPKGYVNNAWHQVRFTAVASPSVGR